MKVLPTARLYNIINDFIVKKSEGKLLKPEMLLDNLPELYEFLKNNEEKLLPDFMTYELFVKAAQFGYDKAKFEYSLFNEIIQ